jgi:hypothetical protein
MHSFSSSASSESSTRQSSSTPTVPIFWLYSPDAWVYQPSSDGTTIPPTTGRRRRRMVSIVHDRRVRVAYLLLWALTILALAVFA